MTKKGYDVLTALVNNSFSGLIKFVVVGRDVNIDRDYADEIRMTCKQNQIDCFEKNEKLKSTTDYCIAISWRWLIPETSSQLIVLHDSILPKYRGFAPLVNMLINKETKIGVTAFFADKEFDRGDIILQSTTEIEYPIKIKNAIDIIALLYIDIIVKLFKDLIKGIELSTTIQNEENASYSLWLNDDDYLIDWNKSSKEILNFINSVSAPYKGASTFVNGKEKVRILDAEIVNDVQIENRHVGKILFVTDKLPVIVCGDGLLKITQTVSDDSHENILPFKNFRIKLSNSYQ